MVVIPGRERVSTSAHREAYRYPRGESWESLTWAETGDRVNRLAAGLIAIGFVFLGLAGGSALLLFSRGEALRLDVECLECELTDLGTDDLGRDVSGEYHLRFTVFGDQNRPAVVDGLDGILPRRARDVSRRRTDRGPRTNVVLPGEYLPDAQCYRVFCDGVLGLPAKPG